MSEIIRTYSELSRLLTFRERYEYLRLQGLVGEETFGFDRYINQILYHSKDWRRVRDKVIIRDEGCDLGIPGRDINDRIIIHHMNPISIEDIRRRSDYLLNPNFLVATSHNTHLAIHYGDEDLLVQDEIVRFKNDTCPWKH